MGRPAGKGMPRGRRLLSSLHYPRVADRERAASSQMARSRRPSTTPPAVRSTRVIQRSEFCGLCDKLVAGSAAQSANSH